MARVLIVLGLAALAFAVYAIVDCALTDRRAVRGLPKWAWIAVILLLPVIGGAMWLIIGAGRMPSRGRPVGPDDDPAFLGRRPQQRALPARADDAEWQRLEQELAKLDSEADPEDDADRR